MNEIDGNSALSREDKQHRRGEVPADALAEFERSKTAEGHQSGGDWRFERFAGDRCRVQVQVQCASERSYCPSSVDRSASRTVSRPLRVFVPSNAAAAGIDSTRAGAFRFHI